MLPSTALMPLPENSIREKTKTLCADLHQASVPQVVGRRWSQLLSVRDGGKKKHYQERRLSAETHPSGTPCMVQPAPSRAGWPWAFFWAFLNPFTFLC